MGFYKDKRILVTGGTGMIGKSLVEKLIKEGGNVRVVSIDDPSRSNPESEFIKADLTRYENCEKACHGMDYVFHVAGIKVNTRRAKENPASVFVPTILFNTNMMEAAKQCKVERYLYTILFSVYSPAEVFYEDEVWKSFPSENDKFAGWAKRMGELQAEAYKIEYGWDKISIVRPSNIYGPYDTFHPEKAMGVAALIRAAVDGQNPLVAYGDGTQIRDFLYVDDAAEAMMLVLEKGYNKPINIGSGVGHPMKDIINIILDNVNPRPEVFFDTSKPSGDKRRVLDTERIKSLGWFPEVSLEEGIKRTIEWYNRNKDKDISQNQYNVLS